MANNRHNHKKTQSTRPVILYKNDTFVYDSLSKPCFSSVKSIADGHKTITSKIIKKVGDRYLYAELKLPELEERCAASSKKDLYKLSKKIADIKTENEEQELLKPIIEEPNGNKPKNNLSLSISMGPNTKGSKINQSFNSVENSSNSNRISRVNPRKTHVTNNIAYKISKESTTRRELKKRIKAKRIKFNNKICNDTTRISQQANQYNYNTDMQDVQLITQVSQLKPQENPMQKTIRQLYLLDIHVKELNRTLKRANKPLFLIILLLLVIIAFLTVILCFDVIIYVNEERRYLTKMESSGIVLKCFYYVKRLLNVPIF